MIFSLHNLGIVVLLSVFTATLYPAYGQIGNLTSLPPEPAPTESIKVVDPITGEKVVAGQELKVAGESSDDPSKDCTVSVIVNNVRPYQNAFPVGAAGDGDYSKWNFVLSENYTGLIQGENKITAKLTCPPPLATRWYSVFVTGVGSSEGVNSNTTQPQAQPQLSPPLTVVPQSNLSAAESNLTTATTTTTTAPTLEPEDEVEEEPSSTSLPLPTTSANTTATLSPPDSETQPLQVSIAAQKNPISRGDNQSITIKVTDSNSRAIPDAEIDGVLIYPGDNYEKDFDGVTDLNGNFVYPWIIGENGDLGELVVQVEVTSSGYEPQAITGSFNLVAPSEISAIGNSNTETVVGNSIAATNAAPNVEDQNIVTKKDGINLVAAGDYGCNGVTEEVVNQMKEKNPDLFLALGDLSEDKNPACFFDQFSDYDGNVKIALGEHDTDSNNKDDSPSRFAQYANHFELDQPYYSFDDQNVHFLAMSTGKEEFIPFTIGSPQYNFVANDLAQASINPNIDWIIVYGYRPFYTSPTVHPGPIALRDGYHPLFEKYGVDLVITAHNHNYQRTYPLQVNELRQSYPIIVDKNDSNYVNPKGPIFVTVGTAGDELYNFLGHNPFVVTQFTTNGFLDIHVSNNGTKTLIASFYDSVNGRDEDTFSIEKL
jgi:calcineurin-like phosphoesterase family protein